VTDTKAPKQAQQGQRAQIELPGCELRRPCPLCGVLVEYKTIDVGYHYNISAFQVRKGPDHKKDCRNFLLAAKTQSKGESK
jgi:hypothetical protein